MRTDPLLQSPATTTPDLQAKENNFKAVLESIRDLMNEDAAVPAWLHDILLGYGDPGAAQYTHMEGRLQTVDFKDTFLDPGATHGRHGGGRCCGWRWPAGLATRCPAPPPPCLLAYPADHVREAFPDYDVEFKNGSRSKELERPFRIAFPPFEQHAAAQGGKRKAAEPAEANGTTAERPKLVVESYTPQDPGPYPHDQPPQNQVRFTPVQTQAILAGVQPGLTMVVGPPGRDNEGRALGGRRGGEWVEGEGLQAGPCIRADSVGELPSPTAFAGTGKTDTAVQIMHILYHNCPNQRTLVVTHSNQALNDLFTKVCVPLGVRWGGASNGPAPALLCPPPPAQCMPPSPPPPTHTQTRRLWSATCRPATCCGWAWARQSWRRSWISAASGA